MEAIAETKTEYKPILWYYDREIEQREKDAHNKKLVLCQQAADILNAVLSVYPFDSIASIPSDSRAWEIKRYADADKQFAADLKRFKIESLQFTIPGWIKDISIQFEKFNNAKAGFTQILGYVLRDGDTFKVDHDTLEKEFARSQETTTAKRYLTEEQAKRLVISRKYIELYELTGEKPPYDFMVGQTMVNNPYVRLIGDRWVANLTWVVDGVKVSRTAPMIVSHDYYKNVVL